MALNWATDRETERQGERVSVKEKWMLGLVLTSMFWTTFSMKNAALIARQHYSFAKLDSKHDTSFIKRI